jgi:phosphopentomutase
MIKRVIWIVLDSVGIGALPDAKDFGDIGAHTLKHVIEKTKVDLQHMNSLGLRRIVESGFVPQDEAMGCYGKCAEISNGKDTTIGHWEMVGIHTQDALPTYPNGFPEEVIRAFEERTGRSVLGNVPSSGTTILDDYGLEHMKSGGWIVYTSADSVFQIAAHEEVIPLEELYEACEIARSILKGDHGVARVIARPYIGEHGLYERTANRRDYSLMPAYNLLNRLQEAEYDIIGIGKIEDIFNGSGITEAIHTDNNMHGVDLTIDYMGQQNKGLIFTNLVDFDSKWGHRNDVQGYGQGLKDFDQRIPEIIEIMNDTDLLMICADHGCDPTYPGTDHTREYVPLLVYGNDIQKGIDLGVRQSFADMGQTVADIFNVAPLEVGKSFYQQLIK